MIIFFARHPTAANLLMLALVAIGIITIPKLRRETFPDFKPNEVEIRVVYPGSTAEEVEEVICQRIEDALDGVKYVEEIRSQAREGLCIVTVEMEKGADFQVFNDDIDSEVDAIDDFPADIETPIITRLGTRDVVVKVLISGAMSTSNLKAYCENLKDRLQSESEISLVKVQGFSDHQFRIVLSSEALIKYNLSVSGIADIISRQNVSLPTGSIETHSADILIRFVEERRTIKDLEDLVVIGNIGGADVHLRDLGKVTDVFEIDEDKIVVNGKRGGMLQIEKTKNQDIIKVANIVKSFIHDEEQRQPQLDFILTQDGSTLVTDRLTMLIRNGLQGMILVFFTMWLFFNIKLSFWVVMSLPVSFLGAFYLLPYFNLTINMLTMVGLLLALGLLMDDGIVIAENIAAHLSRGIKPMKAAIAGVNEVKIGVFSSFITTVCVLGPLATIEGDIGKVLKVVPMILIVVMTVSLIEAFLILPAHLGHSLHEFDPSNRNRFRSAVDSCIDTIRENVFGRCIDWALSWRYLFIGGTVFLFLISIGMIRGGYLKIKAFPDLDGDVIVARILLPQGTPLLRTETIVEQVNDALTRVSKKFVPDQPEKQDIVRASYVQYNQNSDAFESGAHLATIYVDLLSADIRNARIDDITSEWRRETGKVADVISLSFSEPSFGPAGRPIEIRFYSDNLDESKRAADEVKNWLSRFAGVFNLSDDLRPGKLELRLKVREGAFALGLDSSSMARQLRSAFQGITADEIQVGRESYEIDVQLSSVEQDSLADLDYFHFTLPSGKQVPLESVASIEYGRGWSRVARVNGRRTVTLLGDINSKVINAVDITTMLKQELIPELKKRYPNVILSYEGEIKEGSKTQTSMMRSMLVGLLGVFILLSFQFRSYLEPLVVMIAIPLALIGVIWGHLVMRIDLSMPSMLGFISLAGIVVNDSIILLMFLKARRSEGYEIIESAAWASRLRFRAIVLTSITTIAGLLPLLAEKSLQAQILIPLAISIVFGMMVSTVLVLIVIPCLYAVLGDFGLLSPTKEAFN